MFPNDPQMVLFKGKIRKGENVYLHKLPFYGPDGKPQFVQGAHDREFYSKPSVKGIKPVEIKAVPVNKYLNLIRTATPQDLELRKQNMKQGVAEMDSQGYTGSRDRKRTSKYGSRDDYELGGPETTLGPDSIAKPKDVAKKGADALNRAMSDAHKKKGVAEAPVNLVNKLEWPEIVDKVNSAMKAMGWKGERKDDSAYLFSTKGAEADDQYYFVIIENSGQGFFTYALGTVEEGDPYIGEKDSLPNTEASVSELMNSIREGFGLAEEQQQCPECGGAMFSELLINEKKDACYYKVKSRYKVWPSAYASGALVQCRKKGAKNWGSKS
jgi:hypothetical protein